MALTTLPTAAFASGSVGTGQLADGAVTTEKLVADVNFRNLIINGDMSIAQRGTSVSSVTTTGYRTCDRWNFGLSSGGTWTVEQSTDAPNGFSNSIKLTNTTAITSAGAICWLKQDIEAQNLQHLGYGTSNAKVMKLSFYVKSNKTGSGTIELRQLDNSNKHMTPSYTINSANTWEYKTITIPADTSGIINNDNGSGIDIRWHVNSGSNYNNGTEETTWTSFVSTNTNPNDLNVGDATSDYFALTGVQLEVGTTASDFEFLPYDINLQRCQRYYEIAEGGFFGPVYGTSSDMRTSVPFKATKRANPTLTKITGEENCCSSVTVTGNSIDQTLGARVQGTNVFSAGASKFFNAKFSADSEL